MIPGSCRIEKLELEYLDGERLERKGPGLSKTDAKKLRDGRMKSLVIKAGRVNGILQIIEKMFFYNKSCPGILHKLRQNFT